MKYSFEGDIVKKKNIQGLIWKVECEITIAS